MSGFSRKVVDTREAEDEARRLQARNSMQVTSDAPDRLRVALNRLSVALRGKWGLGWVRKRTDGRRVEN